MSKQLSHREVLEVIRRAIEADGVYDTEQQVFELVSGVAEVVASHLGYTVTAVAPPMETPPASNEVARTFEQCWSVGFLPNECTPCDGGILADYDRDIGLKEWWEQGGLDPGTAVETIGAGIKPTHDPDWNAAYNRIADRQGWGPDSERTVLLEFIAECGLGYALPAFAARTAAFENGTTAGAA